jgi:hypothetical protein
MGGGALRLPVAGAAEFALQTAGDGDAGRLRRLRGSPENAQFVARELILEAHDGAIGGNVERYVGPVRGTPGAIVLGPAFVVGGLGLITSGRQAAGLENIGPVAVRVLQPGAQAVGLPVAGAAEFALKAAGRSHDL